MMTDLDKQVIDTFLKEMTLEDRLIIFNDAIERIRISQHYYSCCAIYYACVDHMLTKDLSSYKSLYKFEKDNRSTINAVTNVISIYYSRFHHSLFPSYTRDTCMEYNDVHPDKPMFLWNGTAWFRNIEDRLRFMKWYRDNYITI